MLGEQFGNRDVKCLSRTIWKYCYFRNVKAHKEQFDNNVIRYVNAHPQYLGSTVTLEI